MTLQFIHDNRGNTTGVYIPIEDWQKLKALHADLQQAEIANLTDLAAWQKQILDTRLMDYYNNPDNIEDFDKTLDDIEKSI